MAAGNWLMFGHALEQIIAGAIDAARGYCGDLGHGGSAKRWVRVWKVDESMSMGAMVV